MSNSSTAYAPGPFSAPPPGSSSRANVTDILGSDCKAGDFTCYKNQVSDNQIVTALWVSIVVGLVALALFAILRSKVTIFHTRLNLGSVWVGPPPLPKGGIHHLWSWLFPLFRTSDAELIHSCGLDALILSWVCSMGVQIFLPVSILGAVMLLPINLSGNRVSANSSNQAAASTFSKLTVSNIARGSGYYWVVFAFVYIVTLYICWVLLKYYQAYVILRQHYLVGGENLINEWHLQFLAQKEAAEKDPSLGGPPTGALAALRTIFDPASQAAAIAENLEEAASIYSGHQLSQRLTVAGAVADARGRYSTTLGKESASAASGKRSMLSAALRRRRLGERAVSPGSHLNHISPTSASFAYTNTSAKTLEPQGQQWSSTEEKLQRESANSYPGGVPPGGLVGGPGRVIPPPPQEMGHRREGSELTREVLEAAGLAPSHDAEGRAPSGIVLHEPGIINPGGGGLRSALKERIRGRSKKPSDDLSADEEEHVKGRNRKSVRFLSGSFGRMRRSGSLLGRSKDRSDSQELMDKSLERSTSLASALSTELQADGQADSSEGPISRFERDAPKDEGRERIHQWWRPAVGADQTTKAGSIQAGKPNVSFRKIVNTTLPDGGTIGVNAQSYTVLVMDVPDISRERQRARKRAARRRWWWRLWYRFTTFLKVRVLLRKNVDRRTGDFIMPKAPTVGQQAKAGAGPAKTEKAEEKGSRGNSIELSSIQVDRNGSTDGGVQVWPISEEETSNNVHADSATEPAGTPPGSALDKESIKVGEHSGGGKITGAAKWQPQQGLEKEGSLRRDDSDVANSEISRKGYAESAVSPRSTGTVQVLEEQDSEKDDDEVDELDSELLVSETFKNLFPDSFDGVLPIRKHKAVDLLLAKWNKAWHKLMAAEQAYVKSGCSKRPEGKLGCCGCTGARVDLIDHWAKEIRQLEIDIVLARHRALNSRARTSYFVFFTSQKDAAIAAQTNLHPEDGHSFQVYEAPGPEEVNWQALWMSWSERDFRGIVTLIPLAVLIIFPIGLFSGAVNQATVAVCNGNSFFNIFYSEWYCKKSSLARSLVTGVLPSVLLMLWQNLVMPSAVYRIAQQQGTSPSLSSLDRRVGIIFFVWDIFNVFLGAMLGGSIFSQLGTLIKNPGSIASSIGTALPTASNFFINFIILQAFATQTVRMLIPHLGIIPDFFRLCGACMPKSDLQAAEALSPHSIRYGRELGAILLIYLEAMAYAATSPIILPFALIYFGAAWVHWRYNILYVSERCYESGGRSWDMTFQCMVWILFIFELFTGFVLLANSAFAQATILWITMTPLLYKFAQYCEVRYGSAVRHMPIETAAAAPMASVPAVVYMPPALRKGAAGWYPEFGKAWENFGMPTYTW